jgi:hypothetical protein
MKWDMPNLMVLIWALLVFCRNDILQHIVCYNGNLNSSHRYGVLLWYKESLLMTNCCAIGIFLRSPCAFIVEVLFLYFIIRNCPLHSRNIREGMARIWIFAHIIFSSFSFFFSSSSSSSFFLSFYLFIYLFLFLNW